jgi:phospholipid/cholesterol/gamma-HCH transport system ATP-binding protein
MEVALEVRKVSLRIEDRMIFRDLNFRLGRGEVLYILGASGSGKSLLIKICIGLIIPEEGEVTLGGVDVASAPKKILQELRTQVGFVFQGSALLSNMAVYDNVALPLRYHTKWSEEEIRSRVGEKMALFGVDRALDRSIPAQLSLEMHKRVALARAFVQDPEFFMLDQPTSGLESEKARSLARVIRQYQKIRGASLLEVGSEWPFPGPPADRVGLLEGGCIVAEGTPEEMAGHMEKVRRTG